jgi:hypothetical protein
VMRYSWAGAPATDCDRGWNVCTGIAGAGTLKQADWRGEITANNWTLCRLLHSMSKSPQHPLKPLHLPSTCRPIRRGPGKQGTANHNSPNQTSPLSVRQVTTATFSNLASFYQAVAPHPERSFLPNCCQFPASRPPACFVPVLCCCPTAAACCIDLLITSIATN